MKFTIQKIIDFDFDIDYAVEMLDEHITDTLANELDEEYSVIYDKYEHTVEEIMRAVAKKILDK